MTMMMIIIIIFLFVCDGKRPPGQKFFMHFHLLSILRMGGVITSVPMSRDFMVCTRKSFSVS